MFRLYRGSGWRVGDAETPLLISDRRAKVIKGIVIGCILAVAISVGCVFYYFSAGLAPVATADPPMPFEKRLANMALDAIAGSPALQAVRLRSRSGISSIRSSSTLSGLVSIE